MVPFDAPAFDAQAAAAELASSGWVVLDRVISPDLMGRINEAVDATMDRLAVPFGANPFLGERTRRIFNLLAHDPAFAEIPVHDAVLAVAERALDPELLLSSLTAVETQPGQDAQPLHCDDGSIPLPRPHPPLAVVAIWALTDFTADNGATRLVPGSHELDRRPRAGEDAETLIAEMAAGSVLVYNGSMWHGGGPNHSTAPRRMVICNYCAGWIRQEENQQLGLPRDLVAGFPRRLQQLVGYGVYRGLHGHVDGTDPGSWLDPSVETDLVWKRMR